MCKQNHLYPFRKLSNDYYTYSFWGNVWIHVYWLSHARPFSANDHESTFLRLTWSWISLLWCNFLLVPSYTSLYSVRGLERSELGGSRGCPGRLLDQFLWPNLLRSKPRTEYTYLPNIYFCHFPFQCYAIGAEVFRLELQWTGRNSVWSV